MNMTNKKRIIMYSTSHTIRDAPGKSTQLVSRTFHRIDTRYSGYFWLLFCARINKTGYRKITRRALKSYQFYLNLNMWMQSIRRRKVTWIKEVHRKKTIVIFCINMVVLNRKTALPKFFYYPIFELST